MNATSDLLKTFGDVEGYDDMVLQKIYLSLVIANTTWPTIGVAHVAYLPNKNVVGLSKLARTVEVFSKRLQTQREINNANCTSINERT